MEKTKAYTPSGVASWATKLGSEFLGTIFLSWVIGLLGVTFSGVKFESLISFGGDAWISRLAVGFWVAFGVLICLAAFSRWSCDLNPAVTTYRMLSKQHSLKYGFIKIAVQMVAALVAGVCLVSTQAISHAVSSNPLDAIDVKMSAFKGAAHEYKSLWSTFTMNDRPKVMEHYSDAGKHLMSLLGDFTGALILMWPIFTKSIKSSALKDLLVVLIVGFGVAALLELGTAGWNPARTLATNYIFDIMHGETGSMELYWAYAVGPILAAFALYYSQIGFHKYVSPAWDKWINWGKVKDR